MTVKFRVGFTLSGETLFGMIAKMLPVENLSVEEIAPARVAPAAPRQIAKPKRLRGGPNLKGGINRILVEIMADGEPHRAVDMQPAVVKGGFAANSVSSRLDSLYAAGIVDHLDDGRWRLVK